METHSKNTGFGGLSRRRCLAIWNSAAWRASKGGKSENSIAWEAVTAGKSENSLAWEAPTGGKSENSLAWGEKWKFPSLGSPHGGKSENSLAWGAPTGGEVKFLSLGSPHGGKPPLAPLTDRNKPAVIVDSNTAFVPSVFSRKHPLLLLIHCANASLLALLSFESASVDSLGITSPTLTTPHLTHQLYPTPQCERGCLKPGHWRGIWQHHHLLRKIILIAMIPTLIACIMNILWTWRGYWLSSPSEILHMICC